MLYKVLCKKKFLFYGILIYVFLSVLELWLFTPLQTIPSPRPDQLDCPAPFTLAVGDVPGPGSVDSHIHNMENITR